MGMRGLLPHILFLFHSVPLLPLAPGDREQTGLAGAGVGLQGLARDKGPAVGPHAPMPALGPVPLHPPTKEDENGLALLLSPRSVDEMCGCMCVVCACVCTRKPVCRGRGGSRSLTCLHLSPRPAAHSPRPPSGG